MHPVTRYLNYFLYDYLDLPRPKPEPKPEPKRFGLEQAEAAAQYVNTPEAAKPVMAVVVGVLGYENRVAEDLGAISAITDHLNNKDCGEITSREDQISHLKAMVRSLRTIIDDREAELAEKKRIAALFTA